MLPDAVSSHPWECFPGQALGLNKTPRAGELTGGAPSLWTESVFQKGFQMSSLTSFLDSVVWQHLEYRRQLAWGLRATGVDFSPLWERASEEDFLYASP